MVGRAALMLFLSDEHGAGAGVYPPPSPGGPLSRQATPIRRQGSHHLHHETSCGRGRLVSLWVGDEGKKPSDRVGPPHDEEKLLACCFLLFSWLV